MHVSPEFLQDTSLAIRGLMASIGLCPTRELLMIWSEMEIP